MTVTTGELERTRTVELQHVKDFVFEARFGQDMQPIMLDEPPPLGSGAGPDAARLLAAAVGDCLSASLTLCLQKSRVTMSDLRTQVTLTIGRNEAGRLRITQGAVKMIVTIDGEPAKLDRCAHMFEDYCIVTASVRKAFPITVEVANPQGQTIYSSGE